MFVGFELITFWVLVVMVIGIAFYDVFAVVRGGIRASVSGVLYRFAQRHPIVPFVIGLIAGHVFWPNQGAMLE